MPRGRTSAERGIFHLSKKKKTKTGAKFSSRNKMDLGIFWTGANLSTKQPKTGTKLNAQNRLDRPTADQLAQNNPRPGQNKILKNRLDHGKF